MVIPSRSALCGEKKTAPAQKDLLCKGRYNSICGATLLAGQFCCRGHFEYIVETQMDEGGQDDIDIFQMIELAVQGRRRKGHSIFVPSKYVQTVSSADLGVMAAYADTFAAVNTAFG